MRIFLLGLMTILSAVCPADALPSTFRGYAEINEIIKARVMQPCDFELGQYLGEAEPEAQVGGLTSLLGAFRRDHDLNPTFSNGHPNSLTLVLWSVLLGRLSDDLGGFCEPRVTSHAGIVLSEGYRQALMPICSAPRSRPPGLVALKAYWDVIMGFDAPDDEFHAWMDFAQKDFGRDPTAREAVSRMTLAAWLSPYFLLRN